MIKKILFLLFTLVNFGTLLSQTDTISVMKYLEFSKKHLETNLDSAKIYADKAIKLSEKNNFYKGLGYGYSNLGIISEYRAEYAQSILNNKKSKEHFEKEILQKELPLLINI